MKNMYFFHIGLLLFVVIPIFGQNCIPEIGVKGKSLKDSLITIDCSNKLNADMCLKLDIEHTEFKTTSDYQVKKIDYLPISNYNKGTKIKINKEDHFSNSINIPFNFCFYEKTYNKLVIGNNGMISFNENLENQSNPWNIQAINPSNNLITKAIFGVYQDLSNGFSFTCQDDPKTEENECGEIYTEIIGTYPCRKFIIKFYNMALFNCPEGRLTSQIVLYEGTNEIEVYIESKPASCEGAKEKKSLLGIINEDGKKGLSPEKRNTSEWETKKEAWRFFPTGTSTATYKWKDKDGKIISNEKNPNICNLKENDSYTLELEHPTCMGETQKIIKTFYVKFDDSYPKPFNYDYLLCDTNNDGVEILDLNKLNSTLTENKTETEIYYYLSLQEAENNFNKINSPVIVNNIMKTYYYRVANKHCFSIGKINTSIAPDPENKIIQPYKVCDYKQYKVQEVVLSDLVPLISGDQKNLMISFFKNIEDAKKGINSIEKFNATENSEIIVKISRNGTCEIYSNIKFVLIPVVDPITIEEPNYVCVEPNSVFSYDFTSYENRLPSNKDYVFSYFLTEDEAIRDIKKISNPKNIVITSQIFNVYIRAKHKSGDCFIIHKVIFKAIDKLIAKPKIISLCDTQGLKYQFYNITSVLKGMLMTPREAEITLYKTLEALESKDQSLSINPKQASAYKSSGDEIIYVRFEDKISKCVSYTTIRLELILFPEVATDQTINVCIDPNGQLTTYIPYLPDLKNDGNNFEITWHENENNANNGSGSITNIDKDSVWVRVSYSDCFKVNKLKIIYSVKQEELLPKSIDFNYCDNLNDKYEEFDLTKHSEEYFSDYKGENYIFYKDRNENGSYQNIISDPKKYNILSGKDTIYVVRTTGVCKYIARRIVFKSNTTIEMNNARDEICLSNLVRMKEVDLRDFLHIMNPNYNNLKYNFYINSFNATEKISEITNYDNYSLKIGANIFYVRMENDEGCFNIKLLTLIVRPFPDIVTKQVICDNNNDLVEKNFVLATLNNKLVPNIPSSSLIIKYYLTIQDAENKINEIKTIDMSGPTKVIAQINNGICINNEPILLEFIASPNPNNITIDNICDYNDDEQESMNLISYQNQIIKSGKEIYTFGYYPTENDALLGTNIIRNPNNYVVLKSQNKVFVRVYNSNLCFTVASITFNLFSRLNTKDAPTQYICDIYSNTKGIVDLTKYLNLLSSEMTDVNVEYFYKLEDAKSGLNKISNPKNIELNQINTIFYIKFIDNLNACYSIKQLPINLQLPPKLIQTNYAICDNDFNGKHDLMLDEINKLVVFNHESYNFSYHFTEKDAANKTNEINKKDRFQTNVSITIFVRVDNGICNDVTKVTLVPNNITKLDTEIINFEDCEQENGSFNIDLTQFKSQFIEKNLISNTKFEFYTSIDDANNQTNQISNIKSFKAINQGIFVRITNQDMCPKIAKINLIVKLKPIINMPEEISFCENSDVTLDAGIDLPNSNFTWNNGLKTRSITVNKPGIYTVEVVGLNGCINIKTINVKTIKIPVIKKLIVTNNSIRVVMEETQKENEFEYSINDGKTWQKSNLFENLKSGRYSFLARSLSTYCISNHKSTIVLDVHNIVTPNNDKINDSWIIDNLDVFEGLTASLKVFDRYGKTILTESSNKKIEWNGSSLNRSIPSGSYWYQLNIPDGREYTGYVVVKNRN